MFSCPYCFHLHFGDLKLFRQHFRYYHNIGELNFKSTECVFFGCNKVYNSWSGFLCHLKTHTLLTNESPDIVDLPVTSFLEEAERNEIVSHPPDEVRPPTTATFLDKMAQLVGNFSSAVLSRGVTQTVLDFILREFQNTLSQLIDYIISSIRDEQYGSMNDLCLGLSEIPRTFDLFKSSYRRNTYFTNVYSMVNPIQKYLGSRYDVRVRNGQRGQVVVSENFSYVPILQTLANLLQNPYFLNLMKATPIGNLCPISKFSDSLRFKQSPFFQTNINALQIQLFVDEFETCNPLGSKKGIHKMGAVYFTIQNLPSYLNSQLKFIQLLALYFAEDRVKHGINAIVDIVLHDVKELERNGVKGADGSIRLGTVSTLSFDNLGGNGLLGFHESFSSNNYCRICYTSKEEARVLFAHDQMRLRDKDGYIRDANLKTNGVNFKSALNDLTYFHFLDAPTVDIMHDLLEGVVQLEIKLVLKGLVLDKVITESELNARIDSHNYGYIESKNKPGFLNLEKDGNSLGLKSAQAWCLLRILPVIIYDKVGGRSNRHWKLIVYLLEIVALCFSPSFSEDMLSRLDNLIVQHHTYFNIIFPQRNLLPKHHFMCHYSYVIKTCGPLVSLWCMRYEAKHNYFAQLAGNIRNFRNIAYSLAQRHEQAQAHFWNTENFHEELKTGNLFEAKVSELNESYDFLEEMIRIGNESIDATTQLHIANEIWFRGTHFKPGYIAYFGNKDETPIFREIDQIVVFRNSCFLVCLDIAIKNTVPEIFGLEVERNQDKISVHKVDEVLSHYCTEIQRNCNKDADFLMFRHYL